MATPKLFKALSVLENDEWSSFKKFLLMHVREDSDNYNCYKILHSNRQKLISSDYSEVLKNKHFPGMSQKVFSNLLSRLHGWFEDWFAVEIFRQEDYAKELNLIKGYNQKGLFNAADSISKKLTKKIQDSVEINQLASPTLKRLHHLNYYSNNPNKRINNSSLFFKCVNKHITVVLEESLTYLLELVNLYDSGIIIKKEEERLLRLLVGLSKSDTALSKILTIALKMIADQDDVSFISLKQELESDKFDKSSDLFLILTTYLRRTAGLFFSKEKLRNPEFLLESFQLNLLAIEKNNHQKLLPNSLFNMVDVVAYNFSYKQTQKFIDKWIGKLHTEHKESAYNYCKALNEFRHYKYDQLQHLLNGQQFDELINKYIANALMIIAHYKLGEEDFLLTQANNFKKQLKRNSTKVHSTNILSLKNLTDIILLLQKAKYDSSVAVNIEKYKKIFYRSWVLKELE